MKVIREGTGSKKHERQICWSRQALPGMKSDFFLQLRGFRPSMEDTFSPGPDCLWSRNACLCVPSEEIWFHRQLKLRLLFSITLNQIVPGQRGDDSKVSKGHLWLKWLELTRDFDSSGDAVLSQTFSMGLSRLNWLSINLLGTLEVTEFRSNWHHMSINQGNRLLIRATIEKNGRFELHIQWNTVKRWYLSHFWKTFFWAV